MHVELPTPTDYPLVIQDWGTNYLPYFILGPVVFCEARSQVVAGLSRLPKGSEWLLHLIYSGNPLAEKYGEKQDFPDQRVVYISSPFFPHKLSKGYGNPVLKVVESINGHAVKNLVNLVEVIRDLKDDFLIVEVAGRGGETLVFPRKEMIAATEAILTDNGIRSQGSADAMAVWTASGQAKAAGP